MRPASPEILLEALAEALETMAFVSPEPVDGQAPTPSAADCISIRWTSKTGQPGEVQLATSCAFGEALACNILALDPGTPEAAQRAVDALQELCNVTTGGLLARLCENPEETPDMGLPSLKPLSPTEWEEFVARPQTTVIWAEGHPLAFRVEETAA